MDLAAFADLVFTRRSVRGFLPDPIPPGQLREIFRVAQQAPSNCNTQPWTVHVVSGAAAQRMREALSEAAHSGRALTPDFPLTERYEGEYRLRQIGAAKALFAAQGIERHDNEGRTRSALRNFRFFDAPHAAFIFLHQQLGIREAADCGMFVQTLMLALTAGGFASCAQGALGHYADVVRDQLGVAEPHQLLFGIAFGYEDPGHPTSAAKVGRAEVEEAVTFHEK